MNVMKYLQYSGCNGKILGESDLNVMNREEMRKSDLKQWYHDDEQIKFTQCIIKINQLHWRNLTKCLNHSSKCLNKMPTIKFNFPIMLEIFCAIKN